MEFINASKPRLWFESAARAIWIGMPGQLIASRAANPAIVTISSNVIVLTLQRLKRAISRIVAYWLSEQKAWWSCFGWVSCCWGRSTKAGGEPEIGTGWYNRLWTTAKPIKSPYQSKNVLFLTLTWTCPVKKKILPVISISTHRTSLWKHNRIILRVTTSVACRLFRLLHLVKIS